MSIRTETVGASVAAGLATGPRSFTGLAAVVLSVPRDAEGQPDKTLGHPATKTAIGLLALQEWVLDKLPQTPSRLESLGIVTRLAGAGAAGAILARRSQVNDAAVEAATPRAEQTEAEVPSPDWPAMAACAATSAGVALGVALIGVRLRSAFDRWLGHDWPAAALEDASSAGLAAAAVYLSSRL